VKVYDEKGVLIKQKQYVHGQELPEQKKDAPL
jgi:hypothetical protein